MVVNRWEQMLPKEYFNPGPDGFKADASEGDRSEYSTTVARPEGRIDITPIFSVG